MIVKICYLLSNNTIEIFKSLGSAYVKLLAPRNTSPPRWLTQKYFP